MTYAERCSVRGSHDYEADGFGKVIVESPYQGAVIDCPECVEARDDYEAWLNSDTRQGIGWIAFSYQRAREEAEDRVDRLAKERVA